MYKQIIGIIILLSIFLSPAQNSVFAQTDNADTAVYIVQPGDTLGEIAARLGLTVQELIAANQLVDPNSISAGQELFIPGLEGIKGVLTTKTVQLGETLESLSYKYNMPMKSLSDLNRIISSTEIYAGTQLIVVEDEQNNPLLPGFSLESLQSVLELAVINNTTSWEILSNNKTNSPWHIVPGQTLFVSADNNTEMGPITPWLKEIQISPLPLIQGKTTVITAKTDQPIQLTGELAEHKLNFSLSAENTYTSLQGIHAMAQPGLVSLNFSGISENGETFKFSQQVLLSSGGYPDAPALIVDPITLDPNITQPEDDLVKQVVSPYTEPKWWNAPFNYLTDDPCVNAWFGYRRSYNGSLYEYFHTGVDFGVCAQNLNIYAPAPGKVVYTGNLTIRGNATIIDHGHGVYSGIWHQEELYVSVNDEVEMGQKIGMIGNTGRSTGPHLHWEMWVNGVQVNPLDWLETNFP